MVFKSFIAKLRWLTLIFIFTPIFLIIASIRILNSSGTTLTSSTPDPFPTDYPAEKQTAEVALTQTVEAFTPLPADSVTFPEATVTPFLVPTVIGTPAGSGRITKEFPISQVDLILSNEWVESRNAGGNGSSYLVFAGAQHSDPAQGVLYLVTNDSTWSIYLAPAKEGKLTIVGAAGRRLVLVSESGTTLYFDIPGRTFVSALTDTVPTVTPEPSFTPKPTATLTYTDDAPDDPWYVLQDSRTNTNLSFTINPSGDVDWFRFHVDTLGTIQVDLTNLATNYDLYVYTASDSQIRGSSTNSGQTAEQVIIQNAPVDDYYVRVVGADSGQFSAMPYLLRFNASLPPTDTPTATFTPTNTPTNTPTATAMPITGVFYLHGSGATANPTTLTLDGTAPTSTTAKYRDSPSINFNGGNLWKEVGNWMAAPGLTAGQLAHLSDLHVWLGLKNSDDIGTRFDVRADVYKNGVLVASGETDCITNVTNNPNLAKEVVLPFGSFPATAMNGTSDVLSVKILTRVGTNGAGGLCGGHSNAVGLRLYFDATSRVAKFGAP